MNPEVIRKINQDIGVAVSRIEATFRLLEEGATIPFIARYRKEATGNLDEVRIQDIAELRLYYNELDERRKVVLSKIEEQGKLTDELRDKIQGCSIKAELEDLYLPYKTKRKTKAGIARKRGLEPLADYLMNGSGEESAESEAAKFVNEEKEVPTAEAAIEGALHIVAERTSENADSRKWLRDLMLKEGVVQAQVTKERAGQKTKYSMYYSFQEPVPKIPSHRMLAIRRASREKVLTYSVQIDQARAAGEMRSRVIGKEETRFAGFVERGIQDGYQRLMEPSIQNEVRSYLRARADDEAINVFEENLRALLLAAPAGQIVVLGIDPGLRTGSKIAVVDETGKFLEKQTIYLSEPKKDLDDAEKILVDLISRLKVAGIVIGNGTGSRETETFVRSIVDKQKLDVFTVVTNEAGASVYSASKRARQEFPELDITVRGAISIARRMQDPLAELVKIDPKSIGVGQYQHDVDQKKLRHSLGTVVESCVNRVGVDLNTASVDLLKYISGVSESLARTIVEYRNENGAFKNRDQLKEVAGLGEKTFQQAAGFLRIKDGESALDRTSVHPESYPLVERMAASFDIPVSELIENPSRVDAVDFKNFEKEAGRYTVVDIRNELLKPGRDPRRTFKVLRFREDIREITDLKEGMEIEGNVTNVTNFGAFVDLGVHQDGLIHISELTHGYVQDARRAVKVGDVVKVKVIGIDPDMKRISLSRKATMQSPKPRPKPRPRRKPEPKKEPVRARQAKPSKPGKKEATVAVKRKPRPAPPELSMEEKLKLLQQKFKGSNR